MDATLFPQKSPFPTIMPSFNHFEQNAHTCPLQYYPSDWILNRKREPSQWRGRERRDKNTLSPPPSHLVQRSPPLLPTPCCPNPHPPPAPSAPLHGRRLGTKMVVFQRRRQLPHTAPPEQPPPVSAGSLAPKMPDSLPPSRKRRHPSRIPRLPFAAGEGEGEGEVGGVGCK